MKKIILTFFVVLGFISCKNKSNEQNASEINNVEQVPDMHTSQISLDWQGVYQGILPCADCEGIQTEIILNDDLTYEMKRVYLGKSETVFEETGEFKWTKDGGSIVLAENAAGDPTLFKVGENFLLHLDREGIVIKGELAENYRLQKIQ
jgi:copper homeostasis protein (lipoprotein)